jgi:L-threonylcarbamoyladenylate synthase
MAAPVSGEVIEKAVSALKRGGLVALPTDTLYALAAAARDDDAVGRLLATKGRDDGKPLPLFVSDLAMAEAIAVVTPGAATLARRFWPGALTIVLNKRPGFDSLALAGGETVALRVPDQETARAVIAAAGSPITGTSANRSGGPDPVTAEEVGRQLGAEVDVVIDEGPCPVGVASTIVDLTGDDLRILRRGAINEAAIRAALAG